MQRRFLDAIISCFILMIIYTGGFTQFYAAAPAIENDIFWKGLSGNPIYSQGGVCF